MIWWLLALIPIVGLYVARRWRARREADEAHRNLLGLLAEHGGWILRGGMLSRAESVDEDAELSRQMSDNLNV
jgi:hypothetical protein